MESKELTIVIVTFKSEEKISNCLRSISRETPVLVIENSNNVNFKKDIENNFQNVKCILTGENKGYSFANNVGLRLVKTKYALVLNPDTILDKKAIKNFFYSSNANAAAPIIPESSPCEAINTSGKVLEGNLYLFLISICIRSIKSKGSEDILPPRTKASLSNISNKLKSPFEMF